jgi:hypothetical protein
MLHFLIDYMADDSFSIVNSMHDDFFSYVMMSVKKKAKDSVSLICTGGFYNFC